MNKDKIIKTGKQIQDNVENAAFELFGEMRELTPEEQKKMSDYLNKISVPTGINFNDF